jgi:hypothetical protein
MLPQPSRTHFYYPMLQHLYIKYLNLLPHFDPRALPFIKSDWRIDESLLTSNRFPVVEKDEKVPKQPKKVTWAETPEVTIVDRYIKTMISWEEDNVTSDDLEDDLYGGPHTDFEIEPEESSERSTLPSLLDYPLFVISETEEEEEFDPPFPSRLPATTSSENEIEDRVSQLRSLHETLERLTRSRQVEVHKTEHSEETAAIDEPTSRRNRFERDSK